MTKEGAVWKNRALVLALLGLMTGASMARAAEVTTLMSKDLTDMKREQVRRLPVVDEAGVLQGVVSMNDFILLAEETKAGKPPAISCEDVARTLKGISAHRIPVETR